MFSMITHVIKGKFNLLNQLLYIMLSITIGAVLYPTEFLFAWQFLQEFSFNHFLTSSYLVSFVIAVYVTNIILWIITYLSSINSYGILFFCSNCAMHLCSFAIVIYLRYSTDIIAYHNFTFTDVFRLLHVIIGVLTTAFYFITSIDLSDLKLTIEILKTK